MAEQTAALLAITVADSPEPGQVRERRLELPAGATRAAALAAVAWVDAAAPWGIWGRAQPRDHVLQPGDRVELYRLLTVDPKVARRERFARQGARRAGLFAQRRPHSKAGY